MHQEHFYNGAAVEWARQKLKLPVEITPRFSSRAGRIFAYLLLFMAPLAFFIVGIFLKITGSVANQSTHPDTAALVCGFVLLIPFGLIALLGELTRAGFATSLDMEGVNMSRGRKFNWGQLRYVDHVSKYFRYGTFSRRVRDNQLELIFESGKVIIPPLIHNREEIWALVNTMPVEVRDDGVPRADEGLKRILTAIADLKASAGNVTPEAPQPQVRPEQPSQAQTQPQSPPQSAVQPEEPSNLSPELREWLRGPKTDEAVAQYAMEILRRHFDPEGLPVHMIAPPKTLRDFGYELWLNVSDIVREGRHNQMLKSLFSELVDFCKIIPNESFEYRLFLLFLDLFQDTSLRRPLYAVIPIEMFSQTEKIDELIREAEDENRRFREGQMGY